MKEIIEKLVQKHPELQKREIIIDIIKAHQELTKDKLFTVEDIIAFGEIVAWNIVGKTITESFVKELSTKLAQSLLPETEWDIEFVDGKIKLIN